MPYENHSSRNDLEIEQRISPDFNTNKPGNTGGRQCHVPPSFYRRFRDQGRRTLSFFTSSQSSSRLSL